jgi:hypothetical protein
MSELTPTVFDDAMPMTEQARFQGDNKLFVQFYRRAIHNEFESNKQGRPVYFEQDYIKIIVPGDKLSQIDTPMDDHYKQRFGERYKKWLETNGADYFTGTPIDAWPVLTLSQKAELKHLNINTVEDLANCSDQLGQKIMGFNALQKKAKAFLIASDEVAAENELNAKVEAAVLKHTASKADKTKADSLLDK